MNQLLNISFWVRKDRLNKHGLVPVGFGMHLPLLSANPFQQSMNSSHISTLDFVYDEYLMYFQH